MKIKSVVFKDVKIKVTEDLNIIKVINNTLRDLMAHEGIVEKAKEMIDETCLDIIECSKKHNNYSTILNLVFMEDKDISVNLVLFEDILYIETSLEFKAHDYALSYFKALDNYVFDMIDVVFEGDIDLYFIKHLDVFIKVSGHCLQFADYSGRDMLKAIQVIS